MVQTISLISWLKKSRYRQYLLTIFVTLLWIPEHSKEIGNEEINSVAKEEAKHQFIGLKSEASTAAVNGPKSIFASFGHTSLGSYIDWSSPTLPKLTTDESYAGIKITSSEASWIASSATLGVCVGSFLAAWLLDRIGRKYSLIVGGILMFMPWIAISFPINALMMILCRFIGGIGGSLIIMVNPIYLGEIVDKDIRGRLALTVHVINACGSILTLSVGPFVSYTSLNVLCATYPFVLTCSLLFAPESPYYLIKIHKDKCARASLQRLNNYASFNDIDVKFDEIKETVQTDMECEVTFKQLFLQQNYRRSLGIIIGLRTLQQLSGVLAMSSYMQTIMEMANTGVPSEWISVIYSVLQLPAGITDVLSTVPNTLFVVLTSALLVDWLGRKPLLGFSSITTFVVLTLLGVFFYLQETSNVNLDDFNSLPAVCICLYVVLTAIGVNTLPYVIFGELLATNVKQVGGLLFTFYGAGLGFAVIKMFNPIAESLGVYTMFWIFAGSCFLGVLFIIFVLPETKNKSLAEIQKKLQNVASK